MLCPESALPDWSLTRPAQGVLVECDPSIKTIIVAIDSESHDFIIEDLDNQRLVIKENMVPLLKQKLEEVRRVLSFICLLPDADSLAAIETEPAGRRGFVRVRLGVM